MSKASPDEQAEPLPDESLMAQIRRQVLHTLGTPKDLLKVRVHPVGGDRYRVNVVTGKDFATGRISNSYFLSADAKGKIVGSEPAIVKAYGIEGA